MNAPVKPAEGISEARAAVVEDAALSILTGLEVLNHLGGWFEGDTMQALHVRWVCGVLQRDAEACLRMSDPCQPEPEAS